MACATGIPSAQQAAQAVADRLAGREPRLLRFRYVNQCISLGRRDGLIQFVGTDDSPREAVLTGRVAALYKEAVVRSTILGMRRHSLGGQPVRLTRGDALRAVDEGHGGVDDADMDAKPVNLTEALASFDEIYSPRIVARMNDYDVRIAHAKGEHVWHVHEDTDEFFLVLDGQLDVAMRDAAGNETTVVLRKGDTFVVPKGTEHKPSSPGGSVLMFEPSGTSTTGDCHEGEIPDHVDSTTGHTLAT